MVWRVVKRDVRNEREVGNWSEWGGRDIDWMSREGEGRRRELVERWAVTTIFEM